MCVFELEVDVFMHRLLLYVHTSRLKINMSGRIKVLHIYVCSRDDELGILRFLSILGSIQCHR